MSIDLSTCKPGQKLRYRNGVSGIYSRPRYIEGSIHECVHGTNGRITDHYRDGRRMMGQDSADDIVEILQMPIDLRTCVPGQKLRTGDGTVVTYVGPKERQGLPHTICRPGGDEWGCSHEGHSGNDRRCDWIVEILPLETQPAQTMSTAPVSSPAKPKTPREIYLAGQAAADFKPGERVKVLFKVPSRASGWDLSWNDSDTFNMDQCVGKVFTVVDVQSSDGIRLSTMTVPRCTCDFKFPYFCLERVAPEPVEVVLNDAWTAEVLSKDEVRVGCQTFKAAEIRTMLVSLDALPAKGSRLNASYVAEWNYPAPTTVKVSGKEIPVENLRKLLAAVDAFAG
jgi:hypothetical protein